MIDFGLTSDEFRTIYFEQEPHVFRGALAERPFEWPDIDQLLHVVEPSLPGMRMFQHGVVPQQEYTEETAGLGMTHLKLNKVKFYRYMANGATLLINRLEDYSVAAKRLSEEIARFAGAQTRGDAYMSFSGGGSFGKHWDTHDSFAIQLLGRKRWKIFPPTLPLPLAYQTSEQSGHECPAEPALEFTLEVGDVVYLPRGWWHHVIPLDEGSFHLSVGVYGPSLLDFFRWASSNYLEQQVDVRRAFSSADHREVLAESLEQLRAVLLDPAYEAEFERDAVRHEPLNAEFNLNLFLDSVASPLSAGALVGLTTFHATVERGELPINGAQLSLDDESQAIVAVLRDGAALQFDVLCERLPEIPLDAMRKAVLNLARHDVVTIRT